MAIVSVFHILADHDVRELKWPAGYATILHLLTL